MRELSGQQPRGIGRKAVRGAAQLGLRQVLVHGMNLAGGIVLARVLAPGDFGVFAILNFFIALAASLSELGFGYRLLRQAREPDAADYQAVFSLQAACSIALVAALAIASGWISQRFRMGSHGSLMIMAVSANILLAPLQSMAIVSLERRLDFGKLARLEVLQTLLYHAVTVGLAFSETGAWSFVGGAVARSILGAVVLRIMAPWKLAFFWDWERIRLHVGHGLLYQASTLANIVRDSIVPTLIGSLSGPVAVGYVTWALMLSLYTNLVLNVLNRVYLPVFSRLQDFSEAMGNALTRAVAWTNRFSAPITLFVLVFGHEIIVLVFTEKWLPALPLVKLLLIANVFVATSTPCFGMLNALGEVRRTFGYSLMWTVLTWGIGGPLIMKYGYIGFGWAILAVNFTNILLFRDCLRRVPARFLRAAIPPWIWASLIGIAAHLSARFFPASSLPVLALYGFAFAMLFVAALWAFHKEGIRKDWSLFSSEAGT